MAASVEAPAFVEFAKPAISSGEIDEVVAVLESGWLTTGPRVHAFEAAFADYIGVPHAVAVNSCTAALHLSLLAAGVGPGDEVVTTPLTFCATANVIVHTGATPVFADVDQATMNLDPDLADAAITPRTRAIVPVHFAGRPVDLRAFRRLADARGLALIEDAAHCIEGAADGRKVGTNADFTCFSFYATKNVTTGEGGMVTTASGEAADWIRVAALHGMSRDAWRRYSSAAGPLYQVVLPGYKYNMMDLQAAIGLHQLARIDALAARRRAIWDRYDAALADLPVTRPAPAGPQTVHARHLYTVLVDESVALVSRDRLRAALKDRGIGTSVHFQALHLEPYYASRFGFARGAFPNAEFIANRTVSLPLSAAMTDDEAERVIAALRDVLP
jgi:dTDP-4-amino-4,6-dideoxygalactose transaminase